jgi:hypothetical protein
VPPSIQAWFGRKHERQLIQIRAREIAGVFHRRRAPGRQEGQVGGGRRRVGHKRVLAPEIEGLGERSSSIGRDRRRERGEGAVNCGREKGGGGHAWERIGGRPGHGSRCS